MEKPVARIEIKVSEEVLFEAKQLAKDVAGKASEALVAAVLRLARSKVKTIFDDVKTDGVKTDDVKIKKGTIDIPVGVSSDTADKIRQVKEVATGFLEGAMIWLNREKGQK